MDDHERPPTSGDLFRDLLALAPRPRMISGALLIAGGVASAVLLWNRGFVWGLTLFAAVGGIVLFFSGIHGIGREKARAAALVAFRSRQEELVGSMLEEKRQGRNPVRWLGEAGIHDPEFRSLLLEAYNARLKAGGLPENPAQKP